MAWDDRHRLALVVGLLAFFILFGLLSDLESFQAKSLVSLATLIVLWVFWHRVNARTHATAESGW